MLALGVLSLAGHSVACHFFGSHASVPKMGRRLHEVKSNIALRLTPKVVYKDSPARNRLSKARGSRQFVRWVANPPLCVPRERANQEAS
jgi:hypothetical protein